MNEIKIGLLGLGTVGTGVVKVLQTHGAEMQERAGCRLTLHAIADADTPRRREGLDLERLPIVPDAALVLEDPAIQVVIELVGGLEPARTFILKALEAGKHVVTANKALLAHHGPELFEAARRNRVMLGFEAAVAGGVPLIRAVKDGLPANRVLSAFGIVNGTCNYILSKMADEKLDFSAVLKEAQAHGYAESDPTLDIEGMDSAHKLQILATIAFRTAVDLKDIHTEGITGIAQQDVENAAELGYRIKLLAIAKASDGALEARVHPTMIPVEIARRVAHGIPAMEGDLPSLSERPLPLRRMDDIRSCYYLRVMAMDRPGVLAQVAGILGQHDISLVSVLQKERAHGEAVPVVMMTHEARERDMRASLQAIDRLPVVAARTTMIRVEPA